MIINNYEKKTLIIAMVFLTLITISLSIVSFINWTWLTGFLMGSLLSIMFFLLNSFFSKTMLSKKRDKKIVFLAIFIKLILMFVLLFLVTWIVAYSNHITSGSFFIGVFDLVNFLCALGLIPISLLFYVVLLRITEIKRKGIEKDVN